MSDDLSSSKLKEIFSALAEGSAYLNALPEDDDATLVFGITGHGKSAVLAYLAQRKIHISKKDLSQFHIDLVEESAASASSSSFGIGNGHSSKTKIPCRLMIDEKVFWDTAGLLDTNGDELVNSVYVSLLARKCKKIRIVIVLDEHDLRSKALGFRQILSSLNMLLNDRLEQFADSISLIISKASSDTDVGAVVKELRVLAKAKDLGANEDEKIATAMRGLLRLFNEENVAIFHCPTAVSPGKFQLRQEDRQEILKSISSTSAESIGEVGVALTADGQMMLRNLFDSTKKILVKHLEQLGDRLLRHIRSIEQSGKAKSLQKTLSAARENASNGKVKYSEATDALCSCFAKEFSDCKVSMDDVKKNLVLVSTLLDLTSDTRTRKTRTEEIQSELDKLLQRTETHLESQRENCEKSEEENKKRQAQLEAQERERNASLTAIVVTAAKEVVTTGITALKEVLVSKGTESYNTSTSGSSSTSSSQTGSVVVRQVTVEKTRDINSKNNASVDAAPKPAAASSLVTAMSASAPGDPSASASASLISSSASPNPPKAPSASSMATPILAGSSFSLSSKRQTGETRAIASTINQSYLRL